MDRRNACLDFVFIIKVKSREQFMFIGDIEVHSGQVNVFAKGLGCIEPETARIQPISLGQVVCVRITGVKQIEHPWSETGRDGRTTGLAILGARTWGVRL